jgi:biopolymer transport protein ExbB
MKSTSFTFTRRLLLGAALLLAAVSPAHAWWNDDWSLRRELTVDATALAATAPAGADTSDARPVLVRLHDGNFQFAQAAESGADIRFVAADEKTVLAHHIERYDSLLNEAFVWVKVPGLKSGAKVSFWLYYGKAAAPKVADAKATYDEATRLVYHFGETGAPFDATRNVNNAANAGTPVVGSLIGPGYRLIGTGPVRIPVSESLKRANGEAYTWSAWIKPTAEAARAVIYSWGDRDNGFEIGLAKGVPYFEVHDGAASARSAAGAPLALGAWKHLAVVSADGVTTLFVDGAIYAKLDRPVPSLTDGALLGADPTGGNGLVGEIDELQISNTARSIGWVKLAAVTESGSPESQKVFVYGAEEAAGGGGHSEMLEHVMLFGDIAKNMMFDGWIAVACCCIMMVVGWVVAFKKFAYLKRTEKGTAEFLRRWKTVSSDLTVIDHGDAANVKSLGGTVADEELQELMQESPLYHIYHIGSEEIHQRIISKRGFNGLSGRSITAIKASLDAGLTREVHRLNSGLVSLTIGIAGGPYVGLMGTVVGVMITFAVIAKTGQVEVNSIAPGIASALLATVFGLLVAIPALFLYSFLNSRIKDAVSDMQIFIDEFITKMAEFYPEPDARNGAANKQESAAR